MSWSRLLVADADVVGLGFLHAQNQHIRCAVNLLGLADLVANLLVGLIQHNADTGGLQQRPRRSVVNVFSLTGSTLTCVGASRVGERARFNSSIR